MLIRGFSNNELPEKIALEIQKTYKVVMRAVENLNEDFGKLLHFIILTEDDDYYQNVLSLPVQEAYKILLRDLRFDYMSMRDTNNNYKHHYANIASSQ